MPKRTLDAANAQEFRLLELVRQELRESLATLVPKPIAPIAPVAPVAPVAPIAPVLPVVQDLSGAITYKLGRIESLLEEVKSGLASHVAADDAVHKTDGDRIGSLERSRSWGLGVVAATAALSTLIANFGMRILHI